MQNNTSYRRLLTEGIGANKVAVVTYGRFNPPTKGHRLLIDTVIQQGKELAQNADVAQVSLYAIVSPSKDAKRNPLPQEFRERILNDMIEERVHIGFDTKEPRTLIEVMTVLDELDFNAVTVVVGSDRVAQFQDLLDTYNNKPDKKGRIVYAFDDVRVVQAGDARTETSGLDPDSEADTSAVSATALRKAAAENKFDTFLAGFFDPENKEIARETFKELQTQLGVEVAEEEPVEDELADDVSDEEIEEIQETRQTIQTHLVARARLGESSRNPNRYRCDSTEVTAIDNDTSFISLQARFAPGLIEADYSYDLAEAIAYFGTRFDKPLHIELKRATIRETSGFNRGAVLREALRRLPSAILKRVEVRYL